MPVPGILDLMESWRAIAALNNAEWCDVICRSHGARTRMDDVAWTSSIRTPPYYPDAVTLVPDLSVPDLLARIDSAAGCSIKDSFASLNLATYGFRVLFDAQWIVFPDTWRLPETGGPDWELVRDLEDFSMWVEAWRGAEGPTGVLRSDVLAHDSVAVLAARSVDRIVAGAIATYSSNVVGISISSRERLTPQRAGPAASPLRARTSRVQPLWATSPAKNWLPHNAPVSGTPARSASGSAKADPWSPRSPGR